MRALTRVLAVGCLSIGCFGQAPVERATPIPKFEAWTDPTERAFTVNVPQGWTVSGGTHRNSPIDARNFVAVQSPEKNVIAWVDDPGILPRQAPHPAYYRLGWVEGKTVQSPAGPLKIERFRTGAQYAEEFVEAKVCRSAESVASFDLPGQTQRINAEIAPAAARAGVRAIASAGEYVFHCGARSGYTYAVTVLAY